MNSAILVDEMGHKEEISNKVVEFLKSGDCKLSKYYHLLKTHKIPADTQNASSWLENNGFPLRGIVSGCGAPTERLSSFVDHHLQEGMTKIDSFLQDTKHTLQVIEELNEKVEQGDINLEGVALVSLDVENMYNNMSAELGTGASEEFLENGVILLIYALLGEKAFFCFCDIRMNSPKFLLSYIGGSFCQ